MKKLLGIVVLGLLWCNVGFTETKIYPNGEKYIGEFKNGKRHGQGTLEDSIWKKYVGEWKDDEFHGQGTFIFPESAKYVTELKDGEYHGQGMATMSFGTYVGKFKDGKYHGKGTLTLPDGRVLKGNWINNFLK